MALKTQPLIAEKTPYPPSGLTDMVTELRTAKMIRSATAVATLKQQLDRIEKALRQSGTVTTDDTTLDADEAVLNDDGTPVTY